MDDKICAKQFKNKPCYDTVRNMTKITFKFRQHDSMCILVFIVNFIFYKLRVHDEKIM